MNEHSAGMTILHMHDARLLSCSYATSSELSVGFAYAKGICGGVKLMGIMAWSN